MSSVNLGRDDKRSGLDGYPELKELDRNARTIAVAFLNEERLKGRMDIYDRNLNLDHDRKLYFSHNPKCMGTSLKS